MGSQEKVVSAQKSTNFLADNATFQMQSAKIKVKVQQMALMGT
jgi:hypothetical protein